MKNLCSIFSMTAFTLFSVISFADVTMDNGTYESKQSDGTSDVFTIRHSSDVSLEQTRQVGGKDAFLYGETLVLESANCRFKMWGNVDGKDAPDELRFRIKFVHQVSSERGQEKSCRRFVDEFNGRIITGWITSGVKKSQFTKLKQEN